MQDNELNDFIKKANIKYNSKYDYSYIDKLDSTSKLKIYCPKHNNVFYQLKNNHLNSDYPCKQCKSENKTKEIIEEFILIHGDKYDYSLVNFVTRKTHVKVLCKKHNHTFLITPDKHINRKQGCPICAKERTKQSNSLNQDEVINRFRSVHNDRYDYSKVVYDNMHTKVIIICPIHGEFEQTPNSHQRGNGCPECNKGQDSLETMISKLPSKFKNYDFSNSKYIDSTTPISVTCDKCGNRFNQIPRSLIQGHGCKQCSLRSRNNKRRLKAKDIINRANTIHNNKYEYGSLDGYTNNTYKWDIKCPIHGWFKQSVSAHLRGYGCKYCSLESSSSIAEKEIAKFIESKGFKIIRNIRPSFLDNEEIDIYIPSLRLAIEYNGGVFHHSSFDCSSFYQNTVKDSKYHLNKFNKCKENNIDLIHIFDFEDLSIWYERLELLLNNREDYKILFKNTITKIYPNKFTCLKVYGKSNIQKIVAL